MSQVGCMEMSSRIFYVESQDTSKLRFFQLPWVVFFEVRRGGMEVDLTHLAMLVENTLLD